MAVDQLRLRLVFVEGKAAARTDLDRKRPGLWAWGYWCLVFATFGLLVFLGFLA
jgi:hypothetical protein